ncbi:MAG: hypothetical protein AAFX85_01965, partial [Pseudomonadota bacterium]
MTLAISKHPIGAIALCLAIALLLVAGLPRLTIDDDLYVYFGEDDPKLLQLEDFEQRYAQEDYVGFVVAARDGDVFRPQVLEAVRALSDEAWQLPYSQRIISLSTYQYSEADGDDLLVGPLIPVNGAVTEDVAARAREIVLSSPETLNRFAGENAR